MIPYPASFYPDRAVFSPAGTPPQKRGDVAIAPGIGKTLDCYVEKPNFSAYRTEEHSSPETVARWSVFTAIDPGAGVDSFVLWDGITLSVKVASRLSGVSWWTECVKIS